MTEKKEAKKVLCVLPAGLLEQIDFVAQVEHRTRSDLIREALRSYIKQASWRPEVKSFDRNSILPAIVLTLLLCLPASAQINVSNAATVDLRGTLPVPTAEAVMIDPDVIDEKPAPLPAPPPDPPEPCVVFVIHGAISEVSIVGKSKVASLKTQTAANIATAVQKLLETVWLINNWGQRM